MLNAEMMPVVENSHVFKGDGWNTLHTNTAYEAKEDKTLKIQQFKTQIEKLALQIQFAKLEQQV